MLYIAIVCWLVYGFMSLSQYSCDTVPSWFHTCGCGIEMYEEQNNSGKTFSKEKILSEEKTY